MNNFAKHLIEKLNEDDSKRPHIFTKSFKYFYLVTVIAVALLISLAEVYLSGDNEPSRLSIGLVTSWVFSFSNLFISLSICVLAKTGYHNIRFKKTLSDFTTQDEIRRVLVKEVNRLMLDKNYRMANMRIEDIPEAVLNSRINLEGLNSLSHSINPISYQSSKNDGATIFSAFTHLNRDVRRENRIVAIDNYIQNTFAMIKIDVDPDLVMLFSATPKALSKTIISTLLTPLSTKFLAKNISDNITDVRVESEFEGSALIQSNNHVKALRIANLSFLSGLESNARNIGMENDKTHVTAMTRGYLDTQAFLIYDSYIYIALPNFIPITDESDSNKYDCVSSIVHRSLSSAKEVEALEKAITRTEKIVVELPNKLGI